MEKFKILVVDDDVNLAFLLHQRLESEGFAVESANSVASGYVTYLLFKPDLVLTDISMGDESGFDLMHLIRNHTPRIRTIYMTSDLSRYRGALDQERSEHDAAVLSKPFPERNLLEAISAGVQTDIKFQDQTHSVKSPFVATFSL